MLPQYCGDLRLAVILRKCEHGYSVLVASVDQSGSGFDQFTNPRRIPGTDCVEKLLQGRTS